MKKIIMLLLILLIFVVGCSKEDNSSYNKYLEDGKVAIANKEYEKGRDFFTLAKEENANEQEAMVLYNQSNNLIEGISSKNNKHYDIAIQLFDTILSMKSESDIVKNEAKDLKNDCEKLKRESVGEILSDDKEIVNTDDKEIVNTKEESSSIVDIRSDYENRLKEIEDIAVKENGIYRHQQATINILKSYNLDELEDAKVVYKLSDELLNNLYKQLKKGVNEDVFRELKASQIKWVKRKMEKEESLKNDQLLKYETLVNFTLDRCEYLNSNYYK